MFYLRRRDFVAFICWMITIVDNTEETLAIVRMIERAPGVSIDLG